MHPGKLFAVCVWTLDQEAGESPLHLASRGGHGGVVAALLSSGARVNDVDVRRRNCCELVCWDGSVVVISLPWHLQRTRHSPLHEAAIHGHVSVLKDLLEHGAYVDAVSVRCAMDRR